ncbi:hypothetical protein D3C71_1888270 [compost metagenome]
MRALAVLGHVADQFPVRMVLGFGQHHAFAGDQFGRGRVARRQCHFHRLDQGFADVADHLASGRGGIGIEAEFLEHVQ